MLVSRAEFSIQAFCASQLFTSFNLFLLAFCLSQFFSFTNFSRHVVFFNCLILLTFFRRIVLLSFPLWLPFSRHFVWRELWLLHPAKELALRWLQQGRLHKGGFIYVVFVLVFVYVVVFVFVFVFIFVVVFVFVSNWCCLLDHIHKLPNIPGIPDRCMISDPVTLQCLHK